MKRTLSKTLVLLSVLGAACFAYGLLIEPKQLKIRQVEFVSETYKGPDIRIGLITDIHIGGLHVPPERVSILAQEMNALSPDMVLLPGDFVNGHHPYDQRQESFHTELQAGLKALSLIEAPTFATLGNHDAWYSNYHVEKHLTKAGVIVLDNANQSIGGLCLVGLADDHTGTPDGAAFTSCPTDSSPIVFTHSPQAWPQFRKDTVLALVGHTHGGQVNLPLLGRRVNATNLGHEYSYGFSQIGGVDMFVSAGVGTSVLPVRFRSPPEIVVITLRQQP